MSANFRFQLHPAAVACSVSALLLSGCLGGSSSSDSGDDPGTGGSSSVIDVRALSNDPALVSGGDVLVEVLLGNPAAADSVVVTRNGEDVSAAFALRGDRLVGLVEGLEPGENQIEASLSLIHI